ncbi:radical SAM family heme chaperone HemW [Isachenkonia alkalipeptolytica]|uniref:Heme chaperone HemW n=1 Tax=Isachenkonia alkalipeptolytica TaxID=2565777 RepID=A0AA44BD26_9CLOT|nr:radical SAM family heme chaperone HemW [Isachenkonia alkalipeptolytica]NBG87929.1 radical SAM family heme chaperone HemW [Isachenkonia alkalipeptolytica]
MKKLSLYIHIPFCKKKCHYCDFRSFQNCGRDDIQEYMEDLSKEIDLYRHLGKVYVIDTLFIGGGTPSMVPVEGIAKIMKQLRRVFPFSEDPEISIEGNPDTLSYDKMARYYDLGIHRLSMGLQSENRELLKTIGRIHSAEDFLASLENARKIGYENINGDLMFGLPGQRLKTFQNTLQWVVNLNIPHISAYGLIINEETELARRINHGVLPEPDEDLEVDMYDFLRKFLPKKGYQHYEISNFAKPGFQCRHNRTYWENREYLGLGLGAHSSIGNRRFFNAEDFDSYHRMIQAEEKPLAGEELLSDRERLKESLMLGLRLREGIDMDYLEERYKTPVDDTVKQKLRGFEKKELIQTREGRLRLTSKGLYLSNSVFREILD